MWSGTKSNQQANYQFYVELSAEALRDGNISAAELFHARALSETSERQAAAFKFAKQLYVESGAADQTGYLMAVNGDVPESTAPLTRRALMLIQSLAPRRRGSRGYAPAHRFLAEFWENRQPQIDAARFLSLHHHMLAAPSDVTPAMMVAEFLMARGKFSDAIDTLRPFQEPNPDVLLLQARAYSGLDSLSSVNLCLRRATKLLSEQLKGDPQNVELRLKLSRAVATQGEILESMFVLVEGLNEDHSGRFVDQLVQRYVIWLSLMDPKQIRTQLTEIELALKYLNNDERASEVEQESMLTTSDGTQISLPAPIVRFHDALVEGYGDVMGPMLIGTDKAVRGELRTAIALLEVAHQKAPNHPVIANNLAWALTQSYGEDLRAAGLQVPAAFGDVRRDSQGPSSRSERRPIPTDRTQSIDVSETAIQTAWQLANESVNRCPDIISFRETRGTIAAITGRWAVAANDLQQCVAAGKTSVRIRQLLTQAQEQPERGDDPSQQKLKQ